MKPLLIIIFCFISSLLYSQVKYVIIDVDQSGINECLTGIDNTFKENQIKVFPNPNNGIFTLEIEKDISDLQLVVINNLGETIFHKKIDVIEKQQDIDLSHLKGTFLIYIYNEQSRFVTKVIIN